VSLMEPDIVQLAGEGRSPRIANNRQYQALLRLVPGMGTLLPPPDAAITTVSVERRSGSLKKSDHSDRLRNPLVRKLDARSGRDLSEEWKSSDSTPPASNALLTISS